MKPLLSHEAAREAAQRAADALAKRPTSDLDIGVLTEPALTTDEVLRLEADLLDVAGPGIRLVSLNEAVVGVRYEVATAGECLFAREPGLNSEFVVQAILQYLDFKYFLEKAAQGRGEQLKGNSCPSS